ncbi:hypothetical protein DFH11DRAFT_493135 [Phellopilus nigrolimitatus]|nr:hypothetical protein DFH11DRAFT_493135 [Phellopilus nigrolimitatus]
MILPHGYLKSGNSYIPNELIAEIFLHCLELDEMGCTIPSRLQAPLTITSVCRLWRNVAINSPGLWTGISVRKSSSAIVDTVNLLDMWISRSGVLPFAARINLGHDFSDHFSDQLYLARMHALVTTLVTCTQRWRVLEVTCPDVHVIEPPLVALVKDSVNLRHLSVSHKYLGLFAEPIYYDFSLNSALETVRHATPLVRPLASSSYSLPALTTLELRFPASVPACATWLDLCPNLEQLVVRLFHIAEVPPARHATQIRRLERLNRLELTCLKTEPGFSVPGLLLDNLELPALTYLVLDMNSLLNARPWPHAIDLLTRSGTSLETLILAGMPMSAAEITTCLHLSPELRHLNIGLLTDGVLGALTPCPTRHSDTLATNSARMEEEDYDVLCPKLERLETFDLGECSLQALHDMTLARYMYKKVCFDLSYFVVMSETYLTPEKYKTIKTLRMPFDSLFRVLSHPDIIRHMERSLYF